MTPTRPRRLVVVVGTGTEVGKTWVSARLLDGLRQGGLTVAARKLAQSYDPEDDLDGLDAAVLGRACGVNAAEVCPPHRWYPVAMAPPMAAASLGLAPFSLVDLLGELEWPAPSVDVGVVETAGGVLSPHTAEADGRALCDALVPDLVLLVADAGLGTINAVRLTIAALARHRVVVVLNRYDASSELHRRNRAWLCERDGLTVLSLPDDDAALCSLCGG